MKIRLFNLAVFLFTLTMGTVAVAAAANIPPTVAITDPTNGTVLTTPVTFTLQATASDSDGSVTQVEFFNGSTSVGVDSNSPYSVQVSNLTAGNYNFSVVATDTLDAKATNSITLIVNAPPTALISSPTNGASFVAPASITINASASDTDGMVTKIEFYEGSNKLGEDTSKPYRFTWSNVAAGSYSITARAIDDRGATGSSTAINVTVTDAPGPSVTITSPTNGTVLTAPASFNIQASVSGSVTQVEFFNGSTSLGVDTGNPYRISVSSLAGGIHILSAVVTDPLGNKATNSVTLIVNVLPSVSITSPTNGSRLIAPATIVLQANVSDFDGSISKVQFSRGTNSLGICTTNPFSVTVKSLAVGTYTFSAVATDNLGGKATNSISLLIKYRPTVTIMAPVAGARLTNAITPLTGAARDSVGVAAVEYSLNSAPFASTSGTTNWNTQPILPPGTNVVRVRSMDLSGNYSLTNTRTFFQVVTSALTLTTNGTGTVSGATNGQVLEIGRGYHLTATPGAGYLFSNWTGSASGTLPTLGFLLQSNMAIHANFVPNPFFRVSGAFNGLFYETNEVRHGSSGDFKVNLTASGRYTAWLRLAGRRYPTSGKLNLEGKATNVIVRLGTNSLTVDWAVDLHGLDLVTGTVTDGRWVASLLGDRAIFNATTNPAPLAGRYTLVVPGNGGGTDSPEGDGWGTLRVTTGGLGVLAGLLADGTAVTRAVALSKNGAWPLYVPLYQLQGSVLGWIQFNTNALLHDLQGLVEWSRPGWLTNRYYPAGFTNQTTLTGSRYLPPMTTTNRVLNLTNGMVVLSGGNLRQSWINDITLGANNIVTNVSSNKLTLALSLPTGVFRGSFLDTGIVRTVTFSGALLQKSTNGAGYFLGTNQSGRVLIQTRP